MFRSDCEDAPKTFYSTMARKTCSPEGGNKTKQLAIDQDSYDSPFAMGKSFVGRVSANMDCDCF